MAKSVRFRTIKRRRRMSLTDYKGRIALLKSRLPRVVVRKSNRNIRLQIVEYTETGDKILAAADSRELAAMQWQPRANIPTAYLTGMLLAKKAKDIKSDSMVLDTGLYKPIKSSVVFAAAKGAIDGGLKLANNIEFNENRLKGQHIEEYAKNKGKEKFAAYRKEGFDATRMSEIFDEVKSKIMKITQ